NWPKSMRWNSHRARWVRPLWGILAVVDGEPVDLALDLDSDDLGSQAGPDALIAGRRTAGHRFLKPDALDVLDFKDYQEKLRAAFVLVDPQERRQKVLADGDRLARAEGLAVRRDDALLEEVVGLVEWPEVLMGRIDAAFMDLPPEVLTTA